MNKWHKRSLVVVAFLLSFVSFLALNEAYTEEAYTKGQATGANEIFDLIGQEKPSNWAELDKATKHNYLQSLGAYPISSGKYKGRVDLDRYFETLGVEQPSNWLSLSTKQRRDFISNLYTNTQENAVTEPKVAQESTSNASNPDTKSIPGSGQGNGNGTGVGNGSSNRQGTNSITQTASGILVEPTFGQHVDGQLILMLFFLSVGISTGFYGLWATAKGKW